MKVLVINCGSSSLKYQLIDSETESVFPLADVLMLHRFRFFHIILLLKHFPAATRLCGSLNRRWMIWQDYHRLSI